MGAYEKAVAERAGRRGCCAIENVAELLYICAER